MTNGDNIHSEDTERDILGISLKSSYAAPYIFDSCTPEDFYNPIRHKIFAVAKALYDKTRSVSRAGVEDLFRTKVKDYKEYTLEIDMCTLYSKIDAHEEKVRILKSYTFRRSIYNRSKDLMILSADPSTPVDEVLARSSKFSEGLYTGYEEVGIDPTEVGEEDALELLHYDVDVFDNIFYRIGGRARSTTELIFARPGQGKTFYIKMKEAMLAYCGYKGLNFHLEDTVNEAAKRLMAYDIGEKAKNIKIITTHKYLHDIIQDIRYYHAKFGIDFFSVDHLGRVRVAGFDSRHKLEAQIEVSNRLTDLCSELNIFGMFAVQPNKSKDREGWRSILREEDLKGATEVFEDAFVVTTLFRPNVYPELRSKDGKQVKDFEGNMVFYDSVYVSQIKNRRQRLEGDFVHLVQKGNKLIFAKDINKNPSEIRSSEGLPYIDEEAAF